MATDVHRSLRAVVGRRVGGGAADPRTGIEDQAVRRGDGLGWPALARCRVLRRDDGRRADPTACAARRGKVAAQAGPPREPVRGTAGAVRTRVAWTTSGSRPSSGRCSTRCGGPGRSGRPWSRSRWLSAARLISVRLFGGYVERRPAWTGVPFVRTALLHATDHSRSPQESLMRLCWLFEAGLPPPLCNQELFDLDGRCSAYPTCSTRWPALSGVRRSRPQGRRRTAPCREDGAATDGTSLRDLALGVSSATAAAQGPVLDARAAPAARSCAWMPSTRSARGPAPESVDDRPNA